MKTKMPKRKSLSLPALRLPDGVENARLADAVYETLLDGVLSGALQPGAIVSELALSKQLEVSRTPVHDALRQLAKDGLVRQQANRRAVVATFERDDVFDIFEMRKLLEGESAARAATRMSRAALDALRRTADGLAATQDDPGWVARWTDFDDEFHTEIARAAASPRLAQDISRYRMLHRGFNKLTTTAAVLQQALREHLRILDALEHRDADAARAAMVAHIGEWQAYFVNHVPLA